MDSSNNLTIKQAYTPEQEVNTLNKERKSLSAFSYISSSSSQNIVSTNSTKINQSKALNPRFESWETQQIKKIFALFQELGPQWKLFVSNFTDRSANSIKNRFYTALRNTVKALFKQHAKIPKKLPTEIPSPKLIRAYQGKQEFSKFGIFIKTVLQIMNYEYKKDQARKVVEKYHNQVLELYQEIYENQQTPRKSLEEVKIQEEQNKLVHENHETNVNHLIEPPFQGVYYYQPVYSWEQFGFPQVVYYPPYGFN